MLWVGVWALLERAGKYERDLIGTPKNLLTISYYEKYLYVFGEWIAGK